MDSPEKDSKNNDQLPVSNGDDIIEPAPAASPIPEPLNTTETAEIIAQLYEELGSELGARLVEANIVLTIAGARGQTEFFINNPTEADRAKLVAAGAVLRDKGIAIIPAKGTFKSAATGIEAMMVSVESLRGYERVSRLTHIPGIKPFDSATGWEGLHQWTRNSLRAMEQAQTEGKIPFAPEEMVHIFTGVIKGYPDVAIFDMCEWSKDRNAVSVVHSDIPHVSLYRGAEPNFLYGTKHEGDPSVVETTTRWGNILRDFYASPWHQQVQRDPVFIQARSLKDSSQI